MSNFLIVTSWDPPHLTQHFAHHQKQTVGNFALWTRTLCGRSLLANGERKGAEMCEVCEDAFDEEDDE